MRHLGALGGGGENRTEPWAPIALPLWPSGLRAFGPLGLQARHAWPALIEAGVFVLRGCVEVAMVKARIDAHVGVIAGERGVQPRPVRAVVELLDARLTPG